MHLERRRSVALKVGSALVKMPEVTAIYVFGSVASGHVDERSDVDIGVVCNPRIPAIDARRDALAGIGSGWRIGDTSESNPIWEAYDLGGVVDGISVELHYHTRDAISEVLDDVVENGAITTKSVPFRPYTMASLVQRSWVLVDRGSLFQGWRKQVHTYPLVLKGNILRRYVPALKDGVEEMRTSAERRLGPMVFIFFLYHAINALTSIVFALNDTYDPADRREEKIILPALTRVPSDFVTRLKYVLEGPFDDPGAIERALLFEQLAAEVVRMAEIELRGVI